MVLVCGEFFSGSGTLLEPNQLDPIKRFPSGKSSTSMCPGQNCCSILLLVHQNQICIFVIDCFSLLSGTVRRTDRALQQEPV